jgi:hypothetical protein
VAGARCYYQQLWSKHANFEYSDTLLDRRVVSCFTSKAA